jgi:ATPase subunit of ABC transporter with duplicated ATPase domains
MALSLHFFCLNYQARERERMEEQQRREREVEEAERKRKEEEEAQARAAQEAAEKEAALARRRQEKAMALGAEPEKGPDVTQVCSTFFACPCNNRCPIFNLGLYAYNDAPLVFKAFSYLMSI